MRIVSNHLKKALIFSLVLLLAFSTAPFHASGDSSGSESGDNDNPDVDTRVKDIIEIDGEEFRDLNDNGKMDPYEDWRLSVADRVEDLISLMTLEEKAGMMLIDTHNMIEDPEDGRYVDEDDEMITENDMRYVIFRQTPPADDLATYTNQLQEVAEETRLGIPVVVTSNPRNHTSTDYTDNTVAMDQHSFWPGTLGLAATRDTDLVKEFAQIAAQEWRAAGIHKIYGYTADVTTDPQWSRIEDTFGEDPELVSNMMTSLVEGFQGEQLGLDSVALTMKHFPGGGARDDGQDPHFENGNFNPYPTEGSLLEYHIPPFEAAIEAGVSSIMPYYAYPSNEHSADQGLPWYSEDQQFEEVGFALNKGIITDLLRGQLGFEGYVNSDTGAVTGNAWGAEDLTNTEKFAKAINAGTNIMSGETDSTPIINAVEQGLVEEEKIDESVTFLLTEMMQFGLFEDPYVDPDHALEVFNNPQSEEQADEAHRKSNVLLRNDENILPLDDEKIDDVKLYVNLFGAGEDDNERTERLKQTIQNYDDSINITDDIEEATHAFVWVQPVVSNWDNAPAVQIGPDTGIDQVDRINEIQNTVPTILAVNMTQPWVMDTIEPNTEAVINTFHTKPESVVDIIRGEFNPTGTLPFTLPADMEAVENEVGDIPGFEEDPSYVYRAENGDAYEYGFGLSYISAADTKTLIDQFDENGEFENAEVVRSLNMHLTAVDRFENQEAAEKVIKHMESFKLLLDHQEDLMSERAYNALKDNADSLINNWQ
ncbi:glycoside hydrolase family 3 N-terminal domain-containing protein [Virgibacillus natechei]